MQQSFSALGVSAHVVRALERRGITTPFPVQQLVLPDALAGVDVLAASPTGSGKTLAFGIPLVERVANASGRTAAPRSARRRSAPEAPRSSSPRPAACTT